MGRERMPTTLSQRLARFVADVEYADLSAAVIDKAKAYLLHFLGVGIAGAESRAALVARGTVERLVASVRQLEQLTDIDQLLALTIAAEKVA